MEVNERQAVDLADKTGLSSGFVYDNYDEVVAPFADDIVDPQDLPGMIPAGNTVTTERAQLQNDSFRRKSFFEKIFGTGTQPMMPHGYEQMNPLQRMYYRVDAGAKVLATRTGARLAESVGAISLKDMELLQEMDGVVASRKLADLKLKESKTGLTPEEQSLKTVYEQDALRWYQKGPEATAVTAKTIFDWVFVGKAMQASGLSGLLDKAGNATLAKFAPKFYDKMLRSAVDISAKTSGTELLTLGLIESPETIVQLFGAGALGAEGDKNAIEEGARAVAFAPIFMVSPALANAIPGPVRKVMTNAMTKVSALTAKAAQPLTKANYVRAATKEFVTAFQEKYNTLVPPETLAAVKKALSQSVDDALAAAKESGGMEALKSAAAKARAAEPMGLEKFTPVDVVDDMADDVAKVVNDKLGFYPIRTMDGTFTVVDTATQQEVLRGVKPEQLGSALDNVAKGLTDAIPSKRLPPGPRKTLSLSEKTELKRKLQAFGRVANDAYKAGKELEAQKTMSVVMKNRERIATLKQGFGDKLARQAAARQIVIDSVPKEEQHVFLNRILKSDKEGGFNTVVDDVKLWVEKAYQKEVISGLKENIASLQKTYGKNFKKAPEDLYKTLSSLYDGVNISSKDVTVNNIADFADDFARLAKNTKSAMSGMDDVPPDLLEHLGNLSGELNSADIKFVSDMVSIAAHRADVKHQIFIAGRNIQTSDAIADTAARLVSKKIKPQKLDASKRDIFDLYGVESDNAFTLVEKLTGKDSLLGQALQDYYRGEMITAGIEREAVGNFHDYMRKNSIDPKTASGLLKDVSVKFGGSTKKITRGELLSMAMGLKDPYVFDNLLTTEGLKIRGDIITEDFIDDLFAAIGKLSDEELKLGGVFFDNNNRLLAPVMNETSLLLNGKRLATEPVNFPLHRYRPAMAKGNTFAAQSVETQSRVMPRSGGTDIIEFKPFLSEYMNSSQQIARYHGTAIPARAIKTILNDPELAIEIEKNGFKKERENLIKILQRSEGLSSDSAIVDVLVGKGITRFSSAILSGRLSTVGTQISSFPAYMSEIPIKYWRPSDAIVSRNDVREMEALSDFLWSRWNNRRMSIEMGNVAASSTVQSQLLGQKTFTEKMASGMVWGDQQAVGMAWNAAKRMAGGDKEAAIKILEDATLRTQPVWNIANRSVFASDKSALKTITAMFRTAQETQLNIAKRAEAQFARDGKWGPRIKDHLTVAGSVINVSLWRNLSRAARVAGIAKTMSYFGVYAPQTQKDLDFEIAKGAAKTALGLFPYGPQVGEGIDMGIAYFMDGYEYKSYAQDPVTNMANASMEVVKALSEIYDKSGPDVAIGPNRWGMPQERKVKDITKEEIARVVLQTLEVGSLASGVVGAAPLREWAFPALRRSKYDAVKMISEDNTDNAVQTQHMLDTFLTRYSELERKEKSKGLSKAEADEINSMAGIKMTADIMTQEKMPGMAASVEYQLQEFYRK